MPGQLQDSQHSHDPEDLHNAFGLRERVRGLVELGEDEGNVEGHDGNDVDDVEGAFKEVPLVGAGQEAEDVF